MNKTIPVFLVLLCATGFTATAQSAPSLPEAPQAISQVSKPNRPTRLGTGYVFPDHQQQFRNFLYSAFGPPGLISSAIGAGLDQGKPAPPEWDSGGRGYAERYGSRFAMNLTAKTTEYTLGSLMHEDVAYHRCDCIGLLPRTGHAFSGVFTAKTPTGKTVFSPPAIVAPYAGSFTAVSAWYPSRYESADAFRIGSTSFLFKAAGNLIGEFIAPRR